MSSPFELWLLGIAADIDGEWGCAHPEAQIKAMSAAGGGSACRGVDTYREGIAALSASLRASDPFLTDLMVRCVHGPNCYCDAMGGGDGS